MNAIYIHIPFCEKKCNYCNFYSIERNDRLISKYVDALIKEIEYRANDFTDPINSIFFGGGTPSLLTSTQFERIMTSLRSSFVFDDPEITVEINPGTVNKDKIALYKGLGVNRASVGVQSFDENELRLLGRIHSCADSVKTIEWLSESGIDNINIDLMIGLIEQPIMNVDFSLDFISSLPITHCCAYMLSIEEGTPFSSLLDEGKLIYPDEDIQAVIFEHVRERLIDEGFEHYEISNFAKDGKYSKHNLVYWDYGQYLGLGCGATSMIGNSRETNIFDINDYIQKTPQMRKDVEILKPEVMVAESVFMGLRKLTGVNLNYLSKRFGIDVYTKYSSVIETLVHSELLEDDKGHIKLTKDGLLISNDVFMEFLP